MRVGLLTTSFPRHDGDIAGCFVLGFARAIAARGHDVRVLAPAPDRDIAAPAWTGVRVRFVRYLWPAALQRTFYGAGVPDNLRADVCAWLGLAPFTAALALRTRDELASCDALVSHWAVPCALVAGALRARRRHLAVLHSADLHLLERLPARRRAARYILGSADRLWFVSAGHRERFVALLPPDERTQARARCHVRPMGIDEPPPLSSTREAIRRELGLSRFTLLTIGRLVPVKGLAEALAELAHRQDLEWLIAGDGPERQRLAAIAARSALRVRLLGTVTGAHKHALLRAADAFVLPSRVLRSGRSEGVPTALLEAMAAGLPVVAAGVGGIPDAIRSLETGILLDPENRGALEAALDRLIADPELRHSLARKAQRESQRQSWHALGPEIEALLRGGPAERHVT